MLARLASASPALKEREGGISMDLFRRIRLVLVASLTAVALTAAAIGTAFAGDGGPPFPH